MYENSFTLRRMLAAFAKPTRFSGRSTRTELLGYLILWWLLSTILSYLLMFADIAGLIELGPASFSVVGFLLWIPFPALAVRRFHDQDRFGWWAIPLVLPTVLTWFRAEGLSRVPLLEVALLAFYLAALVLLFWPPAEGDNRFGPDPRLATDDWEGAVAE